MDIEGNWKRIKTHREKLTTAEMQGLADVLFRGQELWLEEKLRLREELSLALEILGWLGFGGSAEAARILLTQLETRDKILQIAAAEELKRCLPELVKEALARMMQKQSQSSVKAGEILLSYGAEGVDTLWSLWFGEQAQASLRAQILHLLAETNDERIVSLAFLAFLSEEDEMTKAALKVAEKRSARSLWGNVAECLKNPGWQVRGRAAQLLGQWGDERSLDYLREMGSDPDSWVEEERINAMARIQEHN